MNPLFNSLKIAVLLCFLTTLSHAAEIALLDQNYVLFSSQAAEAATAAMKEQYGEQERQVQTLEQSVRQLQSRLRTDADIMTEQEKQQLEQDIQGRLRNREQLIRQLQQVQNERRNEFIRQYQPLLGRAIEAATNVDEFDLIVDKAAVIYHRDSLDITEAVLKEFNRLYQAQ